MLGQASSSLRSNSPNSLEAGERKDAPDDDLVSSASSAPNATAGPDDWLAQSCVGIGIQLITWTGAPNDGKCIVTDDGKDDNIKHETPDYEACVGSGSELVFSDVICANCSVEDGGGEGA